jgi:hypothetical protein
MIPTTAAAVSAVAAVIRIRRPWMITGTAAMIAGTARTARTPAPSLASNESWPDVHSDVPCDDASHDPVDVIGANARTALVTNAAASVN